jgi:hypothetical protein
MALAKSTKQHIAKVADSAATLQLASEEAAKRLTVPVAARAAERLVAKVATHDPRTPRAALSNAARSIREVQEQLQHEFETAMREARSIAREFAGRQVALEAEPLVSTARHALVMAPSLPAAEVEAMWAQHAATSVARRFGTAAIAETMAWQKSGKDAAALPRALARVDKHLEPERKLHSVTQSVGAFNEAKREQWSELRAKTLPGIPGASEGKSGRGTPHPFDDGFRELWSALLDAKTCPVCWGHDGEMVKVGEKFREGATTPLHGHCRCSCITVHIPEELHKYLAGAELDYDALKDDIKDYMGSRKFDVGEGVRHARGFVDEMFQKRYPSQEHSPIRGSSLELTRRVNDRRAYFPNVVVAHAPSLRR